MAIKNFALFLFLFAIGGLFFSSQTTQSQIISKEKPMLVFDNSTMYTLSELGVERIVNSTKAERYKNKDIMQNGKIIMRAKDRNITDYVSANTIIKRGDKFEFLKNAKYNRENYISLKSDEMFYNAKTKIATNNIPFKGRYYDNILNGEKLYFDTNTSVIKANKAHFEIETEKNKDIN